MMKALLVLMGLAASHPAWSSGEFEGVIGFRVIGNESAGEHSTLWIKDKNVRMQSAADAFSLTRSNPSAFYIVFAKQHLYISFDATEDVDKRGKAPLVEAVRTHESTTILGHVCDEVIVTMDGIPFDYWLARDLGKLIMPGQSDGQMAKDLFEAVAKAFPDRLPGVPLRMDLFADGKKGSLQATRIQNSKLPMSLFEVPAGFSRTTFPALLMGAAEYKAEAEKAGELPELITVGDLMKRGAVKSAKASAAKVATDALFRAFGF